MKLMAYSDHPFGDGRVFYTRAQYLEYLHGYADRFGLAECVSFGAEVTDIRREGRRWTVTTVREGVTSSETFDAVAVCSGPFKTPNRQIPGLESFTGEVVHSSEYRNRDRFAGKRVLIVGMAESGADLVRDRRCGNGMHACDPLVYLPVAACVQPYEDDRQRNRPCACA